MPASKKPAADASTPPPEATNQIALLEADERDLVSKIATLEEQLQAHETAFAAGDRGARERIRQARAGLETLAGDLAQTREELDEQRVSSTRALGRLKRLDDIASVLAASDERLAIGARLSSAAADFLKALDELRAHGEEASTRICGAVKTNGEHSPMQKRSMAMHSVQLKASELAHVAALFVHRLNGYFDNTLAQMNGWQFDARDLEGPWSSTKFLDAVERQNATVAHRLATVSDMIAGEA